MLLMVAKMAGLQKSFGCKMETLACLLSKTIIRQSRITLQSNASNAMYESFCALLILVFIPMSIWICVFGF